MITNMQITAETVNAVAVWCNGIVVEEIDPEYSEKRYPALNVQCGDDVKRASLGDYVIKRKDGTYDVLGPMAYLASIKNE